MKKIILLFCLVMALGHLIDAQCPPPGFPQSGNTCPQAPILCETLDGYCTTINNNNVQQPFPGCPNNVLNNDEWFAFYAGTTQITIQITPSNCEPGGQQGLQGAIYQGCGPPWVALALQCPCTTNPFTLQSSNFVIGQIYWIVIDGCGGNVCDYSIDITSGSTVGQPPANPGPITGPTTVYQNTTTNYSISPVTGATSYTWTMNPTLGSFNSNTNSVNVNWTTLGTANLCVTSSNACYSNPTPSCITVNVIPQSAPPNDNCVNAEPIACGQTVNGTSLFATPDPGAPSCTGPTNPGVWYSFVGNGGDATVSTCSGASFNTQLSVYNGTCAMLNCVAGNNDFCGLQSQVTFTTTNGTTYYVLVHGVAGATGTFNLSLTCGPPPPPANDDCANALPITCGQTLAGTSEFATPDAPGAPSCTGTTNPGVWYSFVGNGNNATLSTCTGASFNTQLSVYSGSCAALVCVAGNDDYCGMQSQVTFATTSGTTYYVLVHGVAGATGTFNLTLYCTTTFPQDGSATVACPDLAIAPVPPTYTSPNCLPNGPITPTGPVITNDPNPLACEGTRTYTYTYTDCTGVSNNWNFVYTIEREPFTVPADGASTVSCPSLATSPVTPTVLSDCGEAITPTGPTIVDDPNPLTCEGTRTYMYTYTDCEGNSLPWTFVYTIERQPFALPMNGTAIVSCPALATPPTLPTVSSDCGEILMPTSSTVTDDPNPVTCEGIRTYTYTYTDCEGNTEQWSFVYTIERVPFLLPPNGAATVSCPPLANVVPTPPTVFSDCGEMLTPTGPVVVSNPNQFNCEGTKTYTWTYTDCEGNSASWSFVYTVQQPDFSLPPNGGSTVDCPDDTDVVPTPPVVLNGCGESIPSVLTFVSNKNDCEGHRIYTWTYTDCAGNSHEWDYVYFVEYLDYTVPPSETVTVECPFNASEPIPPVVYDNCNILLIPTGPEIVSSYNTGGCEGSRQYIWTYEDCEGTIHTWSKTFIFDYTGNFFPPANEEYEVACVLYAQPPIPQTLYDNCAREIEVIGPTIIEDISPNGCYGSRTYSYVYMDCAGNSYTWNFTYFANDDEPPLGTCPSGSDIDVTNLACIEDIPCPDSFDFSSKIAELIDVGNFYDVCGGNDITVKLDSWTDIWQCSDADLDSIYTFGRTFYFRIADACGNEYPQLCGITYSGQCLPIETFPQHAWGVEGGEPGTSVFPVMTDIQLIQTLLNMGPLIVGGLNRSITTTSAQCVIDLLPGIGNPATLADCHEVNCVGCNPKGPQGMKNRLAANTMALILNMRYNVMFNNLTLIEIRNQGLDCFEIDPNIKFCTEGDDNCVLKVVELSGTEHEYPYTLGGLLELSNLYLNGNLALTNVQSDLISKGLNKAIEDIHAFWHGDVMATTCDPFAGSAIIADNVNKSSIQGVFPQLRNIDFSLVPNPASTAFTFRLFGMEESEQVNFTIFNQFGQILLYKEFGNIVNVDESFDIVHLPKGMYIVHVKVGYQRFVKKLIVVK